MFELLFGTLYKMTLKTLKICPSKSLAFIKDFAITISSSKSIKLVSCFKKFIYKDIYQNKTLDV